MKQSDEEITAYMRKTNRCPDCGSSDFIEGPSGGMCTNIMCAGCGAKFNMSPFGAERIGEPTKIPVGCIPAKFEEEACPRPLLQKLLPVLGVKINGSDTSSEPEKTDRPILMAVVEAVRSVFMGGRRSKVT
jgi:hypothetical protein